MDVATYKKVSYYKNWFYKLIKKKSYKWVFDRFVTRQIAAK